MLNNERRRPKRQPPACAGGYYAAWRNRVQAMLIQVDRLLGAPATREDQRRWLAQRRELVDLLDPGLQRTIVWLETVDLD